MNTKKEQILNIIDKIESETIVLKETIKKIYTTRSYEVEKDFINSCNYLQMLSRQALKETGYYSNLSGVHRSKHAPEELEGDDYDLCKLVSVEMNRLEEQIKEGNTVNPIQEPDITKEQWLKAMDDAKATYKRMYENSKDFYEQAEDKSWHINPVETNIIMEDDIINAAKGFMVGPVGLFRNKIVEACVQKFDNLAEMHIFLFVQCKTKDMVLYMTYEQGGKYFFRGSFVDQL
jgi:hypothetical protein